MEASQGRAQRVLTRGATWRAFAPSPVDGEKCIRCLSTLICTYCNIVTGQKCNVPDRRIEVLQMAATRSCAESR